VSTKSHRSGGKYSGSHTTIIPFVGGFIDEIHKIPHIKKIALGIIKTGLSSGASGRVKIGYGLNGHILLTARGNTSQQEIHITSSNPQETKLIIAKFMRDSGIKIGFGKKTI